MSETGKQQGEFAVKHLNEAEYQLKRAAEYTKKAGDGATTKKIEKLTTEISTTKKELGDKISGPQKNG